MSHKAVELFLALSVTASLIGCTTSGPGALSQTEQGSSQGSPAPVSAGGEGGEGGEGESTQDLKWGGTFSDRQVVTTFADQVVLPKYKEFAALTGTFAGVIRAFTESPNESTLATARQSWNRVRGGWEKTESFAFGPAGSLGYDGAMDSWPVNETDVQKILSSSESITPDRIAQFQDGQKGMHTIEYLLFGQKNNKTVAQFTERERQYLNALAQDLNRVSGELLKSWKTGISGQPGYRDVIAKAGEANNTTYPTVHAGAQEMVTGMIDCVNEVAAEKLGTPMQEKSSDNFESRFSFQTLADLKANIAGVRNVYFGVKDGEAPATGSLSAYIAKKDPKLDQQIQAEFQAALQALANLPAPLETSIAKPDATPKFQAAQTALNTLQQTLEQKLVPLI
jgi:putative iron-regulated protein